MAENDLRVVAFASIVCIMACLTTITLMDRACSAKPRKPWLWLIAAAIVFGCGVWSFHFICLLGYRPGANSHFDLDTILLALPAANMGALSALLLWRLAPTRWYGALLGGALLGLAIAGTHYASFATMEPISGLGIDSIYGLAAILSGIVFATIALARSRHLHLWRRRIEVAAWLTAGIETVHIIAGSVPFQPVETATPTPDGVGLSALAITVGTVTLAILLVSLVATTMDQLARRTALELERMQLLADLSHEVVMIHRDSTVLQVNAAGTRLFGIPLDKMIGTSILSLVEPGDQAAILQQGLAQPGPAQPAPAEIRVRAADGSVIPVEINASAIQYQGRQAIAMALRDLSAARRDEERVRHLAQHDLLTDLPNRFLLQERLIKALDTAAGAGSTITLLYLDLDRFKAVNDLLGHASGDALLILVAERIRNTIRNTDTAARVGGDEFVILTTIEDRNQIAALATRLNEALARPFSLAAHEVEIGVTIGIASYPADSRSSEALMQSADTALYRAKNEQRGTFRFFESAMDEDVQARRQLERDLRLALVRQELTLHYQPLVNCTTGAIDGFEALLRWRHPTRGLIPPMEFIPLAEETGLILDIGQWVLETACSTAARWPDNRSVAVNISPVQFRRTDLPAQIAQILERTGLPATRLELEITESILMADIKRAIEILSALRALGIRIALDDFGTGYSSLSYLRSFTFDKLKIDRSFIMALGESEDADLIVRTIIGLAHNLGLSITAEGVETPQQLAMVRDHMCDEVQGYLLGRPMDSVDFTVNAETRSRMLLMGTADPATLHHAG